MVSVWFLVVSIPPLIGFIIFLLKKVDFMHERERKAFIDRIEREQEIRKK